MLAQGQSSSARGGGLAADVSSGLIFLKRKKKKQKPTKQKKLTELKERHDTNPQSWLEMLIPFFLVTDRTKIRKINKAIRYLDNTINHFNLCYIIAQYTQQVQNTHSFQINMEYNRNQ